MGILHEFHSIHVFPLIVTYVLLFLSAFQSCKKRSFSAELIHGGLLSDFVGIFSCKSLCKKPTVSEHQYRIWAYLHLRTFKEAEHDLLKQSLFEEACRLEQSSTLLARAKEFLQTRYIVLSADSTLRRMIGEQRDQARQYIFTRLMNMLSSELQEQLDELLTILPDTLNSGSCSLVRFGTNFSIYQILLLGLLN